MRDPRLVAFGEKVRQIRKEKGLSQEALADLAGIDRSYMGHIERSDQNITPSNRCRPGDSGRKSHFLADLGPRPAPASHEGFFEFEMK